MNKRLTFLFAAAAVACCAGAQTHRLSSVTSDSGLEEYRYFYDSSNRLDSTWAYFVSGEEYYSTDKYIYDENGRLTEVKGYQLIDGEYKYINHIYYGYDDNGNLVKRTNYNFDPFGSGEFILGGVYEYLYDENGRMTTRNAYFDEEQTDLFEIGRFTYNSNGQKETESYYSVLWEGEEEFSSAIRYVYREDGTLQEKVFQIFDYETMGPMDFGGETFTYDNDGDISMWVKYSSSPEEPSEKGMYTYDKELALKDVVLPLNNEDKNDITDNSVHAMVSDTVYKTDMVTGVLGFFDIFHYNYTKLEDIAVSSVVSDAALHVFVDASGHLVLNGGGNSGMVRIYDMSGHPVMSVRCGAEGADVSSLPAGVYCVTSDAGAAKFVKR